MALGIILSDKVILHQNMLLRAGTKWIMKSIISLGTELKLIIKRRSNI